jgi:hypothetical protein
MFVEVTLTVEMVYSKVDPDVGRRRCLSGWDATERFEAIGLEAVEKAVASAEAEWRLSEADTLADHPRESY